MKGKLVSKQGNEAKAVVVPPPAPMVFSSIKDAADAADLLVERFPGLCVSPVKLRGKWALQFGFPEALFTKSR